MKTSINSHVVRTLAFLVGVLAVAAISQLQWSEVRAQIDESATTTPTVDLRIQKNISGDSPYVHEDFSFRVTGNGVDETLAITDQGTAFYTDLLALEEGTYTIEEIFPDGFVEADWQITWYGECEKNSSKSSTITIDEGNIDHGILDCQADNQWKPVVDPEPVFGCTDSDATNYNPDATDDDGTCTYDNEVPGCTNPAANNYNPDATIDDGSCDFGNGGQCVDENPGWADDYESVNQGNRKGGDDVLGSRSNPADATGEADWSEGSETGFFSLGFGGSIVVVFDKYVSDKDGDDISIHEATNGTYPVEKAKVEVSQNGTDWEELTEEARNDVNEGGNNVTLVDFEETGLSWIKYVRITDTTDAGLHNNEADGFDLDAVDAVTELCDEPDDNGGGGNGGDQCLIEGYKYDTNSIGLSGWEIGIEYTATTANATSGALFTDITDANGYYCIAEFRDEDPDGEETLRVGEVLQTGWIFSALTVNGATGTAATSSDSFFDIWTAIDVPNVGQTTEVDFYNESDGSNGRYTLTVAMTGEGSGRVQSDDENEEASSTVKCISNATETDCAETYPAGTVVTLVVTPDEGSNFNNSWTVGAGTCTGNTTPCTVTMNSNIDLVAHFDLNANTNNPGGGGGRSSGGRSNGGSNNSEPDGEVLGEQVSVVPVGAPDAGAGGATSHTTPVSPQAMVFLPFAHISRKVKMHV